MDEKEDPRDIVRRAANNSSVKDCIYNPNTYWGIVIVCISFGVLDFTKYTLFQHGVIFLCMYFLSQMYFILGHMNVHLSNVVGYNPRDYVGPYVAWHHHYEKITGLSDLWEYHRLSTIIGPSVLLANVFIWGIPAYLNVVPHYRIMWAYWVPLYFIQSIAHEWYHLTWIQRKAYFFPPTYYLLSAMERIGIIDTKRHFGHHAHSPKNLDEVYQFNDMFFPIDKLFDYLWKGVLVFTSAFNLEYSIVNIFGVFITLSMVLININLSNLINTICETDFAQNISSMH